MAIATILNIGAWVVSGVLAVILISDFLRTLAKKPQKSLQDVDSQTTSEESAR